VCGVDDAWSAEFGVDGETPAHYLCLNCQRWSIPAALVLEARYATPMAFDALMAQAGDAIGEGVQHLADQARRAGLDDEAAWLSGWMGA
jgi:hypothetical protein